MPDNDLSKSVERVRQNRAARAAELSGAGKTAPDADVTLGAQHLPGDTVFDRVTGLTGKVIHVRRENLVVSSS